MCKSYIIGTGSSIPQRVLSNNDLETIVETSDEWIMRRSGIKERRISSKGNKESATDLATQASLRALEMAKISPDTLDMIVVGTVTPDRQFPSAACMVQNELNAVNAAAFDVSAGCSGFLYALSVVDNAIRAGTCHRALVIGVERLSTILNWQDRSTCVLLGDGAGAVVVDSANGNGGILSTHLKSDGRLWDLLYSSYRNGNGSTPEILREVDKKPFDLRMDGNPLFKRAVSYLSEIAVQALKYNSLSCDDIGLFVPHQANIRIIHGMAKNLQIPLEKVYTNVHRYGNTSSASIPLALDEANREGRIKVGDHVLLVAFGAGLTWASSILRWEM
jgi:3-oxoacyl-[acyl-carrier-protein] synthase-3